MFGNWRYLFRSFGGNDINHDAVSTTSRIIMVLGAMHILFLVIFLFLRKD
jgi:hypothetical protein